MKRRSLKIDSVRQVKHSEVPGLRTEILVAQEGCCPICGDLITEGACLDHHHKKRIGGTGRIRGVLHRGCNSFIAKSENNCARYGISNEDLPRFLRNMADYLEADQYPLMHPSEAPKKVRLKKASYNALKRILTKKGMAGRLAPYPASGGLTKPLRKLFDMVDLEPEFYK